MRLIKRFRREVVLIILLSATYFFLRLVYLDRLPIFTDEAIYMRWAQIALNDSSWRFISLTDGKQPMFVWVSMVFMKFIEDPLIAGRLVSVFSGFFTMIGLFLLSYELFKKKNISFFTTLLYIVYPFAQVNDRMALMDGMVATFSVWALYFSILLVRKVRLDIAYTLGFIIGAGVLTKTSNFFSIYLLPFTLLLFDFSHKPHSKKLFKLILLGLFSVIISYGFYSILRLSPLFGMITAKNAVFVYPFSQWLTHPLTYFLSNFNGLFSWLTEYLKVPYIILIVISLIFINKFFKEKILLLLYFALPFLALALFGRIIFPRFIYFMSLYLLPLASWGLNYLVSESFRFTKNNKNISMIIRPLVVGIFIWFPFLVCLQFAINPKVAQIAKADSSQYVNSWAAGWGVKESVAFFKEKGKNQKIFIATEGTFGLMPESMEMYLIKNKNITIKGYWPVDKFPKEALDYSKKMPSYFIFYQKEHVIIPPDFPLKLLFEVRQGSSNTYYRVYQIIP